jgi:IclR family acetate operon transcriptional repressor
VAIDGNAVRSVDRAAALLLALGESQGEAGVTELARRLGLHKSTASRLLATLERRGLVEQDDESGKYRLGLVVIRLAERAERTMDLRRIAMPELERLARLTRETVSLAVLDRDSAMTVAWADGANVLRVGDWTGRTTPLHGVAAGKVLMAALPERDVLRIVRAGLAAHTLRTLVTLEPLLEELARVRRRGFAASLGELELSLNEVAAPVFDARGSVIAAVAISGAAFRVPARRIPELAIAVREVAGAISLRLGGVAA